MAALTANRELRHTATGPEISYPVLTATHIYKGSLVGLSGGYARGLVAADVFVGIAAEECDNTGASGAKYVRVYSGGDFIHAYTGVALGTVGGVVDADNSGDIVVHGAGSLCGAVLRYEAADTALIRFIPTGCFNT